MTVDRSKAGRWALGLSTAVALNLSLLAALSYEALTRAVDAPPAAFSRPITLRLFHERVSPPKAMAISEPRARSTSAESERADVTSSVPRRSVQALQTPGPVAPASSTLSQQSDRPPDRTPGLQSNGTSPDLAAVMRSLNACKDFRRSGDESANCPLQNGAVAGLAPLDPERRAEFDRAKTRGADQLQVSDELRRGLAGHDKGSIVQAGCRLKSGGWRCGVF